MQREAVAAVSADAAVAREAAVHVALDEEAIIEMEAKCEAIAAVSADAAEKWRHSVRQ